RVVGDANANDVPLQIVPVVTSMTVMSVTSDGSSAGINFHGSGFVDGYNSTYQFGGTIVTDASSYNQGPDVFGRGTQGHLSVPLNPLSYGSVTVRTAGGVSAPVTLTATLTLANATATSGTPANAALPSANPGQTITLTGSGLTTSTGVIGSYTGNDGIVRFVL